MKKSRQATGVDPIQHSSKEAAEGLAASSRFSVVAGG